MNVEREIAAANRRIRAQINASAREALIRIGVDPDEVEREEAERRRQEFLAPYVAAGAAFRELGEAMKALFGAFGSGFQRRSDVVPVSETDDADS